MLQALSSLLTCLIFCWRVSLPDHRLLLQPPPLLWRFFFWLSANAINRSTVFSAAEGCFLPQPLGDGCKRQITGISSLSFPFGCSRFTILSIASSYFLQGKHSQQNLLSTLSRESQLFQAVLPSTSLQ